MSDRRPPSAELSWDELDSFDKLNETIGTPFISVSAGQLGRLSRTIRELCDERDKLQRDLASASAALSRGKP